MELKDPRAARKPRRFRLSLSRTLTLGLALLILASLGTSLWIAIGVAQRNTFELERSLSELTVDGIIAEVEGHFAAANEQVEFLVGLIERGEVDPRDDQRLGDLMLGTLAAAPPVSGIAFVRKDYSVLRAGRLEGELQILTGDWSDRPGVVGAFANTAVLDSPNWRGISYLEEFGEPHIIVAEPVLEDETVVGLVFSVVSVRVLSSFLAAFDEASATRSFILYGWDRVLAHPSLAEGFEGLSNEKPLPTVSEIGDPVLASIGGEVIDDLGYFLLDTTISGHVVRGAEEDYIYLYRELDLYGTEPWVVGAAFLSSEVNLPLRRLIGAGVVGLVILLIAVTIGLLVARSIVRPLQRLAGASESIQSLELDGVRALRGSLFTELDVAAKAFDSMVAGLRWFETYVPKTLVLRLIGSGGSSVTSEERTVTVLFTDIVGFTGIGSRLAPAELADLLNAHFTLLAQAIEAEEGTLDKYIGDSVMAFWGAPLDQPDQATRACRAAQAIAGTVRQENARRRAEGEEPLGLRVGLHTGPAIVGNIGAPGRVNYTLIGDTVNIAQRLEALGKRVDDKAEVVVLLSQQTREALGDAIAVEALGAHDLPGRAEPLDVYRLPLPEGAQAEATS